MVGGGWGGAICCWVDELKCRSGMARAFRAGCAGLMVWHWRIVVRWGYELLLYEETCLSSLAYCLLAVVAPCRKGVSPEGYALCKESTIEGTLMAYSMQP